MVASVCIDMLCSDGHARESVCAANTVSVRLWITFMLFGNCLQCMVHVSLVSWSHGCVDLGCGGWGAVWAYVCGSQFAQPVWSQ